MPEKRPLSPGSGAPSTALVVPKKARTNEVALVDDKRGQVVPGVSKENEIHSNHVSSYVFRRHHRAHRTWTPPSCC